MWVGGGVGRVVSLNTEADSDHVQKRGKVETQVNLFLHKKFTVDSTCPVDSQTL